MIWQQGKHTRWFAEITPEIQTQLIDTVTDKADLVPSISESECINFDIELLGKTCFEGRRAGGLWGVEKNVTTCEYKCKCRSNVQCADPTEVKIIAPDSN